MVDTQNGDVRLFQTNDNGDINVTLGVVEMNSGLETSVFLSLFGGNFEDDLSDKTVKSWWGNLLETDPDFHIRSLAQNLLRSIPATSGNLLRIQEAVLSDLQPLISKKIASSIDAVVSIPALNHIKIVVDINAEGNQDQFEFVEVWLNS